MYYRDLTHAAPIVQLEIDLVHTAATGDALTVYLWWMTRVAHQHTQYVRGRYVPPLGKRSIKDVGSERRHMLCS
jgi:hypothetical protein